jgi:hypothetical protein
MNKPETLLLIPGKTYNGCKSYRSGFTVSSLFMRILLATPPIGFHSDPIPSFLSILSIKCRNWFYWADRAEAAERAESKEFPVSMLI